MRAVPCALFSALQAHAFSFVRHGAHESERARVLPRKFSSHDEVNQIAIAAIAQLPECGALSLAGGAAAAVGCVMVISTGPNEVGGKSSKTGAIFRIFERELWAEIKIKVLNANQVTIQ